MPMSQTELEARLREAFPGADIVVEDLAQTGLELGLGHGHRENRADDSWAGLQPTILKKPD